MADQLLSKMSEMSWIPERQCEMSCLTVLEVKKENRLKLWSDLSD